MDIESLLGVEIVDEKVQQRKILRDRISRAIQFRPGNFLNFPCVTDVPRLSSQSIHDLAKELASEVKKSQPQYDRNLKDESGVAKSHLQLNFLRYLNNNDMRCQDVRSQKSTSTSTSNKSSSSPKSEQKKECKRLYNHSQVSCRKSGLTNTVIAQHPPLLFGGGGINIQDRDHFNLSIDQLMEEALRENTRSHLTTPSRDVTCHKESDGRSAESRQSTTYISRGNSSEGLGQSRKAATAATVASTAAATASAVSLDEVSTPRDPAGSTACMSMNVNVKCPLCLESFEVQSGQVDRYMDSHVEGCLGGDVLRVRRSRRALQNKVTYEEEDNEAEEGEAEEGRHSSSRRIRRGGKRASAVKVRGGEDMDDSDNVTDDGGDEDSVYEEEDEIEEEDEESGLVDEEDGCLLSAGDLPRTQRRSQVLLSSPRGQGKVKSEDVTVIDDWEDSQYSSRLWAHQEEVRTFAVAEEEREALVQQEREEQGEEQGEEQVEATKEATVKRLHQFGDVQLSPLCSVEQKALSREHLAAGIVMTDFGSVVDRQSWESLYPYQRRGVEWFWKHYETDGSGGILGDEMGLGKSAQLCVHFGSIARHENSLLMRRRERDQRQSKRKSTQGTHPHMLVVCPATVLQHWLSEFHHWAPRLRVVILHSISDCYLQLQSLGGRGVHRALHKISKSGDERNRRRKVNGESSEVSSEIDVHCGVVCITTYEGLRRLAPEVITKIRWSAVCLDEGQKIRNPEADITEVCKRLPCAHRLILSGTPIQNSLKELWSLFDFVFPGRLGTLFSFETEFSTPIRLGGYSNANKYQAEVAVRTASSLQQIIRPYLLRRRKEDVQHLINLPTKTEQVLFCVLSPTQRAMYEDIILSPEVQRCILHNSPAFGPIMALRKLCNHPMLTHETNKSLKAKAKSKKLPNLNCDPSFMDTDNAEDQKIDWSLSGKLLVLGKILPLWHREGHKVLVFCQMHSMLNLVESLLKDLNIIYMRMDGHTPVQKRQGIIKDFNSKPEIFVLLLTSRTGGVGISLTAANRVILVDPDFNPQTDIQARERAWRIGQKREVTIYRLITKGTIEEKIYQRQIFKVLLSNRILDNPSQKRFFSKSELRELFELDGGEGGVWKNNSRQVTSRVNTNTIAGDLPDDAEVDLESSVSVGGSNHSQTTNLSRIERSCGVDEEAAPSSARDKRLLKALFNGEALSAVYDHDYFEGGKPVSAGKKRKRTGDDRMSELAKKAVDDAIRQLEQSTVTANSTTGRGSSTGLPRKPLGLNLGGSTDHRSSGRRANKGSSGCGSSSGTREEGIFSDISGLGSSGGRSPEQSSASVLSSLRSMQGRRQKHTPEDRTGTEQGQGQGADRLDPKAIFSRLKVVFSRGDGLDTGQGGAGGGFRRVALTTDQVLAQFGDLPDQFAPIFREMLRRVAVFKKEKWRSIE